MTDGRMEGRTDGRTSKPTDRRSGLSRNFGATKIRLFPFLARIDNVLRSILCVGVVRRIGAITSAHLKTLCLLSAVKRDVDASGVEELVPIPEGSPVNALRICNLSSLRPENFLQSLLRKRKYEG